MVKNMKWIQYSEEELKELEQSNEAEEWLNTLSKEELFKYAGKYIAVRDKKVIASSKSLKELDKKLEELHADSVVIQYMEDAEVVIYF